MVTLDDRALAEFDTAIKVAPRHPDAYLERFCKARLAEYGKTKPRAWPWYGTLLER